eukprot:908467-Alexandrium_andersonii.AAC.1
MSGDVRYIGRAAGTRVKSWLAGGPQRFWGHQGCMRRGNRDPSGVRDPGGRYAMLKRGGRHLS